MTAGTKRVYKATIATWVQPWAERDLPRFNRGVQFRKPWVNLGHPGPANPTTASCVLAEGPRAADPPHAPSAPVHRSSTLSASRAARRLAGSHGGWPPTASPQPGNCPVCRADRNIGALRQTSWYGTPARELREKLAQVMTRRFALEQSSGTPPGSWYGAAAETGVASARDRLSAAADPELAEDDRYVIADGFFAYL
jgi:hypothetical protein